MIRTSPSDMTLKVLFPVRVTSELMVEIPEIFNSPDSKRETLPFRIDVPFSSSLPLPHTEIGPLTESSPRNLTPAAPATFIISVFTSEPGAKVSTFEASPVLTMDLEVIFPKIFTVELLPAILSSFPTSRVEVPSTVMKAVFPSVRRSLRRVSFPPLIILIFPPLLISKSYASSSPPSTNSSTAPKALVEILIFSFDVKTNFPAEEIFNERNFWENVAEPLRVIT